MLGSRGSVGDTVPQAVMTWASSSAHASRRVVVDRRVPASSFEVDMALRTQSLEAAAMYHSGCQQDRFLGITPSMAPPAPEEVVRILGTARTSMPDPLLQPLLEGFRRHWLAVARRVRPGLEADFDDAVQQGLIDLVDPDVLLTLREPTQVHAWARSLFCNKLATIARQRGRERSRRHPLPAHVEDTLDWLAERFAAEGPTPEEDAMSRERLAILGRCLEALPPLAKAKFVDDVPDQELAARFGKSNAAVRNYLKRIRQLLRTAVAERS